MFDHIYRKRLRQDVEGWVDQGWVTSEGAGLILKDAAKTDGRSRVPMVLGGIGIVCIALALAAFIAANWGGIPRNVKLVGIALGLLGAHGLAAWASNVGSRGVADLATGFATLVFVGGMALVGQIFHLPSDWPGGAFLVCLGALAAAWIAGSRVSLLVAVIAALTWQFGRPDLAADALAENLIGLALLIAMLLHPVAYPARLSRWGVIVLLLSTYGRWLDDVSQDINMMTDASIVMAFSGFSGLAAVFVLAAQTGDLLTRTPRFKALRKHGAWLLLRSAQDVGVVILSTMLFLALIALDEFSNLSPAIVFAQVPVSISFATVAVLLIAGLVLSKGQVSAMALFGTTSLALVAILVPFVVSNVILVAALVLAALIAISMLGTLQNKAFWTLCGYAGLTSVVLWLLDETIGSLLGQSVFFLVAGILLLGMAYLVTRLLRRKGEPKAESETDAGAVT